MSTAHKETIDQLVKEISARHGIVLGKDDPIMVLYTMNERLLAQSHESQQKLLADFRAELSDICVETVQESKVVATGLMNGGVQAAKSAFSNAIDEQINASFKRLNENINTELLAVSRELKFSLEHTRKRMNLALLGSCFLGACIVFSALLI